MRRKDKGLTMVELMVALAIMAVVVTIAIPYFNAQLPSMRLNGAARKVMSDLMTVRMNAVKLNKGMNIVFSANDYTISSTDGAYSETINIQTHYPRITITSFDNGAISETSSFQFSSRGTTADTSHTVTLTNSEGSTKQVAINLAGQIKIN